MYTRLTFLPTCLILNNHVLVVKQQYFFRNISSSLHIHGSQISSNCNSSVLNLDCWLSYNASANIIVKLKFVILLNQDSFSTVFFQQSLDLFHYCFEESWMPYHFCKFYSSIWDLATQLWRNNCSKQNSITIFAKHLRYW